MDTNTPTIDDLLAEIEQLKKTINDLQIHLSKYTNSDRHKRYYQKNKDRIKQNSMRYIEKLKQENPEKLKEYRHKSYLKRKDLQSYAEQNYAS
jgi:hypothetical protein